MSSRLQGRRRAAPVQPKLRPATERERKGKRERGSRDKRGGGGSADRGKERERQVKWRRQRQTIRPTRGVHIRQRRAAAGMKCRGTAESG